MKPRVMRLSLADLTNLAVEAEDTPMHEGALGVLDAEQLLDRDGHVRIDRLRVHLAGRLNRVPELRRRLWRTEPFEGRPLWIDDPGFRIEDHVLVARLPAPGGESRAFEFAEARMLALMDRSHPLWQLWFLEGYGPGKVGVFLKLHHALADGMAVLNIIGILFDTEAGVVEAAPAPWSPAPAPGHRALVRDNVARKGEMLARAGRRFVHPIVFLEACAASCRGLWVALNEGIGAPRTSLNRPIGPGRKIAVLRLSLKEVKDLAHMRGVKVNDVGLDLVAGGLRRVLVSRGERTEGMSIRASMAVLLPSAEKSAVVGNHAGTLVVPLPVGDDDSVQRLAAIALSTARAKTRQRGAVPQLLMVLLAITGLTRLLIRRQHLVNVLVTNLAGPQFPLYIAGARLLDAFAITPVAGNVTASFAVLSYDGNLDLSVHVDADAWPDLDVLMRGMSLEWGELTRAAAAAAA
jgi:diacylglycerol O-acyltransferase / wax synthase